MAYIKKKSERKFKITVCNGYKVNGQKRMKAQTITVPSSVPKRGIQQYVMAEAERIEKKFKYGVEESDQTHFEQYAENWLKRQEPFFKATTYAGYKRNLDIVYPLIGGIPLAKLLPMTLEEMCEELRKRPGRGGNCIKETTVQKYLETVSSVLEDAKKNDIIPFNPAHRVRKRHFEKEVQHIPQKYEMGKLMRAIQNEPILYRAYYTLAITTGLRRGELCALQWRDITGACELTVRRSRSCASGQIVESDTKSHRERMYERLPACLVTHRQVQRWIFTPTPLTRTSARRRKSWERRLDYDEENQINQRKQKHYAESACSLLLP